MGQSTERSDLNYYEDKIDRDSRTSASMNEKQRVVKMATVLVSREHTHVRERGLPPSQILITSYSKCWQCGITTGHRRPLLYPKLKSTMRGRLTRSLIPNMSAHELLPAAAGVNTSVFHLSYY